MGDKNTVLDLLSKLGTGFGILLNISPIFMILNIYNRNLKTSEIPYLYLFSNVLCNIANISYGILLNNDMMIILSSLIGEILALLWLGIFAYKHYFPEEELDSSIIEDEESKIKRLKKTRWRFGLHSFIIINVSFEIYYLLVEIIGSKDLAWLVSTIFCVINAITPGQKVFQVLKTYKTKLLPIITIMFGFLCTLCWSFYGYLSNNYNLFGSNIGAALISLILICVFIFSFHKGKNKVFIEVESDDEENENEVTAFGN